MRTNYFGHDLAYKRKRERGETGWDTPTQFEKNLKHIYWLLNAVSLPASPSGLELGCGAGNIALRLANEGWHMQGVDVSPTAIGWARERANTLDLDIGFHVADIIRKAMLPIKPVDVVIDGHCLHCIIGADRVSFFRFAERHLKHGGYLLIDTMCGEPWMKEAKEHFDSNTRCLIYDGIASRYLGTSESILQEIASAGFSIMKSKLIAASQPDDQDSMLVIAQL